VRCNFNNFNTFVTLASTRLRLPEDDVDALKYVAVLKIYKILLIYICVCVCVFMCCAFVGLDNELYKMQRYVHQNKNSVFVTENLVFHSAWSMDTAVL